MPANHSSFLQEQLPRMWTCFHLATLQYSCQPLPLGHGQARRAGGDGAKGCSPCAFPSRTPRPQQTQQCLIEAAQHFELV